MAVVPRLRKRTLGLSAAEQEDLLETLHRSKEHLLDDLDTLKKRKTERVEQVLQCKVCKKTLPLKVVGLTRMPTQVTTSGCCRCELTASVGIPLHRL